MTGVMINIPSGIHSEFKKKLIDCGWTQKFFVETQVKNFLMDGKKVIAIPDHLLEALDGDAEKAKNLIFSWCDSYIERKKCGIVHFKA